MSYNAKHSCYIRLNDKVTDGIADDILKKSSTLIGEEVGVRRDVDGKPVGFYAIGYRNYNSDTWVEFLRYIDPYLKKESAEAGVVEFLGEDGFPWRVIYKNRDLPWAYKPIVDGWYEEEGIITYDEKNSLLFE